MLDKPPVTIKQIDKEILDSLYSTTPPKDLNLDNPQIKEQFKQILEACKETSNLIFLLTWEGSKVPRGAIVDGHTITWTQHGQVYNTNSNIIGSYERLVEFGGENKKTQQMVIFLTA